MSPLLLVHSQNLRERERIVYYVVRIKVNISSVKKNVREDCMCVVFFFEREEEISIDGDWLALRKKWKGLSYFHVKKRGRSSLPLFIF